LIKTLKPIRVTGKLITAPSVQIEEGTRIHTYARIVKRKQVIISIELIIISILIATQAVVTTPEGATNNEFS
jgi:hypothetical protein